ncbi:hypothetical protein LCGC14_0285230 [marine sediment metagenome]|uniref:Uncharacterized protein n=2 Tax=root TaxID=1 RepID=A0A9C9NF10_9HYPH|nr:hypothetical protein [Phycisphaerae bacterium]HEU00845.1 hypothetical protein [Aurantimonas coralicida]
MEEHFGLTRGSWPRLAVWGRCLAALCLCNASCIMVFPVGGTATVEAYQWTGHGALFPGASDALPGQAEKLSTQPSRAGVLTELSRAIVIPFFVQDKVPVFFLQNPDREGLPSKRVYELFDPVVLTGSEKRFDYPKRSFVRIMISPFLGFPMGTPPDPGALVFAEGCWPVKVSRWRSSASGKIVDTRATKPVKATLVFNVLFYDYVDDDPPQPTFVLRTVHHPRTRPFDLAVGATAGCGGYNMELVAILDKYSDRLFDLIDKSPALTPHDRLMIYRQLTQLAEGAVELDHPPGADPDPADLNVLKSALPILRAKSR